MSTLRRTFNEFNGITILVVNVRCLYISHSETVSGSLI